MPIVNTSERLVQSWEEVSDEDISDLLSRGPAKTQVKNIRERHHAMARLLAAGYRQSEIAEMLDCNMGTLSTLQGSPAFIALVTEYRDRGAEYVTELRARVSALAEEALGAMHRRFLDQAAIDKVSLDKLSEVTSDLLDRAGVGPVKSHAYTFGFNKEALDSIKSRVMDAEWLEESEAGDLPALAESTAERPQ